MPDHTTEALRCKECDQWCWWRSTRSWCRNGPYCFNKCIEKHAKQCRDYGPKAGELWIDFVKGGMWRQNNIYDDAEKECQLQKKQNQEKVSNHRKWKERASEEMPEEAKSTPT